MKQGRGDSESTSVFRLDSEFSSFLLMNKAFLIKGSLCVLCVKVIVLIVSC